MSEPENGDEDLLAEVDRICRDLPETETELEQPDDSPVTPNDPEVTTNEPEVTTDDHEVNTEDHEVTTNEPEVTEKETEKSADNEKEHLGTDQPVNTGHGEQKDLDQQNESGIVTKSVTTNQSDQTMSSENGPETLVPDDNKTEVPRSAQKTPDALPQDSIPTCSSPDESAPQASSQESTTAQDPLSIENENLKELELMNDINRLQNELKTAQNKVNTLQQQVQAMEKYKKTADSFLAVSEGAPDPVIWLGNLMKVERENLLKANLKNQELTRKIATLEKERNDSVVKNAKIEKSILDAKKLAENATKEMKKCQMSDSKSRAEAERCRKMSNQAIKEHASMKEQFTVNSTKLKWIENKLQTESEALALEKEKNTKLLREVKVAKEETTQIRANTQQIISTYQNSEEVRSNALDGELKTLQVKFEEVNSERNHLQTDLDAKTIELDQIRNELIDAQAKVDALEEENSQLTEERNTMAETLNRQKADLTEVGSRLANCQKLLEETESQRDTLQNQIESAQERAEDRAAQAQTLQERESELLSSISSLTEKNLDLGRKCALLEENQSNCELLKSTVGEKTELHSKLQTEYDTLANQTGNEISSLQSELSELKKDFENASNRSRALEKQNGTLKKELRSALASSGSKSGMTRTQSINSIDSIDQKPSSNSGQSTPTTQSPKAEKRPPNDTYGLSHMEKGEIIQKLINVQKQYVKRNEKIDFLSDHVSQLTEELKKKTKLIQSFLLREQHGRIKPPGKEQELHRKVNSIMDTIYAPNSSENINMMRDINKQLQLVLEDTLFKNIMQQDNIKHLGEEIDKIQRRCKCKPNTR